MDIKQLFYFVTVADQLSYSKAAQKLHISQPSLSNAIKNLEHEVGSPLLERSTRKIEMTDAGKVLYNKSLQLLSHMNILKKEMQEVRLTGSGELIIGMIESVRHWVPKVIREYQGRFPSIRIKLIEVLSRKAVIDSLRKYHTHLIITNQCIEEEDIESLPLYKEKLVLVLHRDHPLSVKESITFTELAEEPFIISMEGFQTREDILEAFALEEASPNIQFEIERFETALTLVRENLGVAIIPENYLVEPKDASMVRKMMDSPALERTVYLTYMKNRYLAPAVQSFLEDIQRCFASDHKANV
ncbi:LysR family transcriptional regulator [Paenibacillus thiaminolyticus]|uniref:LysR family transcriptional regulator n=1 Tax=Paenibacillus thiaminolyticus TaxID=49283 RepID=A0AAP9DZG9_PANTH|nr:LysR family transcriptional regulator [Paenibacillus thiaminolyticus]MCY9538102.1 LysR family transcriptional regulator [Paenibacillus thiaminolyticus]MCY9600666.1 LysR family transcriptional regulator [Paenibacillus thiaminolyticus]MCY9611194.1 LysR family transcriptional regulator [Paenibacillus thiaminolyticus]MCY9614728.1 LysR family transcriptional regulator [Paenibacillus thiaminolyticus]MCY9619980.1 LysR family transcriptional regulator [Paenibacillus thiaminolyticus]